MKEGVGFEEVARIRGFDGSVHLELRDLVVMKAQSLERVEGTNSKCKQTWLAWWITANTKFSKKLSRLRC